MKNFEHRKNTVGVSLTNGILIKVDDYCERTGINRSLLIETVLKKFFEDEGELDRLIDDEVLGYERD